MIIPKGSKYWHVLKACGEEFKETEDGHIVLPIEEEEDGEDLGSEDTYSDLDASDLDYDSSLDFDEPPVKKLKLNRQ